MRKADVKINGHYIAKVSDRLTVVRIDNPHFGYKGARAGWDATNVATGRTIHVQTARRLRRAATEAEITSGKVAGYRPYVHVEISDEEYSRRIREAAQSMPDTL